VLGKYVDLFAFPYLAVGYTRILFLLSKGELYSVTVRTVDERR